MRGDLEICGPEQLIQVTTCGIKFTAAVTQIEHRGIFRQSDAFVAFDANDCFGTTAMTQLGKGVKRVNEMVIDAEHQHDVEFLA